MAAGPGDVYAIGGPETPLVKIGFTTMTIPDRLKVFRSWSPVALDVLWSQPGTAGTEDALHREFADRRRHGEWFDFSECDATHEIHAAYWSHMEGRSFPYGFVEPPRRASQELAVVLCGQATA